LGEGIGGKKLNLQVANISREFNKDISREFNKDISCEFNKDISCEFLV
jgi:hypothetical protein